MRIGSCRILDIWNLFMQTSLYCSSLLHCCIFIPTGIAQSRDATASPRGCLRSLSWYDARQSLVASIDFAVCSLSTFRSITTMVKFRVTEDDNSLLRPYLSFAKVVPIPNGHLRSHAFFPSLLTLTFSCARSLASDVRISHRPNPISRKRIFESDRSTIIRDFS